MEKLSDIGEHEAIRRLKKLLNHHSDLIVGAGDDCAVTRLPGTGLDQVFTTDPVIEDVHFSPGEDPFRIGNKAAGRVLSDLAAMGAAPQWLLVNLVAPPAMEMDRLEAVYKGMTQCCRRAGALIVGGDLAEGPKLEIHVFATGTLPSGTALLRSGARVGDSIYVTGRLGCSQAGKHLDFVPRVAEGLFLRESGAVGAMMDISDGLATDLRHILEESGVGAELFADRIPREGSVEQALYEGEDYELLFTLRPDDADTLLDGWSSRFRDEPVCIGRITGEAGTLSLRDAGGGLRPLDRKAFEHFQPDQNRR